MIKVPPNVTRSLGLFILAGISYFSLVLPKELIWTGLGTVGVMVIFPLSLGIALTTLMWLGFILFFIGLGIFKVLKTSYFDVLITPGSSEKDLSNYVFLRTLLTFVENIGLGVLTLVFVPQWFSGLTSTYLRVALISWFLLHSVYTAVAGYNSLGENDKLPKLLRKQESYRRMENVLQYLLPLTGQIAFLVLILEHLAVYPERLFSHSYQFPRWSVRLTKSPRTHRVIAYVTGSVLGAGFAFYYNMRDAEQVVMGSLVGFIAATYCVRLVVSIRLRSLRRRQAFEQALLLAVRKYGASEAALTS